MPRKLRIGYGAGIRFPGDLGTYTLSGIAAALKLGLINTAAQGAYLFGGQSATLTYTPATSPLTSQPALGGNVAGYEYYGLEPLLVNAVQQGFRSWMDTATNAELTPDANGWPTTDFRCDPHRLRKNAATQTMLCQFNGSVSSITIPINNNNRYSIIAGPTYNAAQNLTTFTIQAAPETTLQQSVIRLQFNGTSRTAQPGPAGGGGITNLVIAHPGYTIADINNKVWTDEAVTYFKRYDCLRFMDMLGTNNSTLVNWGVKTRAITHSNPTWEDAIDLCNRTNGKGHFCIPHLYTNAAITSAIDLIETRLNSNLSCRIEYSNELWNSTFQQFHDTLISACVELKAFVGTEANRSWSCTRSGSIVTATTVDDHLLTNGQTIYINGLDGSSPTPTITVTGPKTFTFTYNGTGLQGALTVNTGVWFVGELNSTLRFGATIALDSKTNVYHLAGRWRIRRLKEISDLVRARVGDSKMGTRFRIVWADQMAVAPYGGDPPLEYLKNKWTARPINDYVHEWDGGAYFDHTPYKETAGATLDQIMTALQTNSDLMKTSRFFEDRKAWAITEYGIESTMYECGPDTKSFTLNGTDLNTRVLAQFDPRMQTACETMLNDWYRAGGGLANWYTTGFLETIDANRDIIWGVTDYMSNATTPKLLAFSNIKNNPPTFSRNAVPGTLDGRTMWTGAYAATTYGNLSSSSTNGRLWALVFAPSAGNYTLRIKYTCNQANRAANITVNQTAASGNPYSFTNQGTGIAHDTLRGVNGAGTLQLADIVCTLNAGANAIKIARTATQGDDVEFYSVQIVAGGGTNQRFVRAGATGLGTGLTWTDAYTSLPATLVRGNTYYIADGTYPAYNFDDAESGTQTITLRKATPADHGSGLGWLDSMGTGQVFFTNPASAPQTPVWTFTTGYYVLDGVLGKSLDGLTATTPFGIRLEQNAVWPVVLLVGGANINFNYIDLRGGGPDGNPVAWGGSMGFSWWIPSNLNGDNSDNITISRCWIHDLGCSPFYCPMGATNVVIEYCTTGLFESFNDANGNGHAEVVMVWPAGFTANVPSNWTFRYNTVTYIDDIATGGVMIAGDDFKIYGNVFYRRPTDTWSVGNGAIGTWSAYSISNVKVYNNTFINVQGNGGGPLGTLGTNAGGNEARNNIFMNGNTVSFTLFTNHSNNHFVNVGGNTGETGATTSTTNPFVDYPNYNFHLTGPLTAGTSLAAPFNTDPDGIVRGTDGTWDRGAYEFDDSLRYVRAGATGAGTGLNWTDAFPSLPATLVRGKTYLVADGTYGGYTFSTANSGTTLITIKKATVASHGTSVGWLDTYGDGEALFQSSVAVLTIKPSVGYLTVDGSTGSGFTPGGYGFRFKSTATRSDANAIVWADTSGLATQTGNNTNLTFKNIEFDWNNGTPAGSAGATTCLDWRTSSNPCNNMTIQGCYFHHSSGFVLYGGGTTSTGWVIDGNYIEKIGGASPNHHECFWFTDKDNTIFRNNTLRDMVVGDMTGWVMFGSCSNVDIYNNVFYCTDPVTYSQIGGNGIVGTWTGHPELINDGIRVTHNTFANLPTNTANGAYITFGDHGGPVDTNIVIQNNLFITQDWGIWGGTISYNAFGGGAPSFGTNVQTGLTSAIFKGWSSFDFHLASHTQPGAVTTFTVDKDGVTRTAPDRGAYEFT